MDGLRNLCLRQGGEAIENELEDSGTILATGKADDSRSFVGQVYPPNLSLDGFIVYQGPIPPKDSPS